MNYEIIATLGPASSTPAMWKTMLAAGATAFRLNTSHLTVDQLQGWLERLEAFLSTLENRPPVVLDLQGSKWRLGEFPAFELGAGQRVELIFTAQTSRPNVLPVPHADFFRAATVSDGRIVLNDAKIELAIETRGIASLSARVERGGEIAPNKGITFVDSPYRSETLSEKDQAILERTRGFPSVRYAISYVKDAAEMAGYRARINAGSRLPAYLIAKLERGPAMEEAQQIAASAHELWLCRGDLGAELGLIGMAEAAARFSAQAQNGGFPVPAILAGQVLEHMAGQPAPTRSEVCYLHDALAGGYSGVVLSDETAIGRYPVESCRIAALFRTAGPD